MSHSVTVIGDIVRVDDIYEIWDDEIVFEWNENDDGVIIGNDVTYVKVIGEVKSAYRYQWKYHIVLDVQSIEELEPVED